jgi:Winged helix DNA-binding domain
VGAVGQNAVMRLSARALNRATLARQMLLQREPLAVVDAVHHVVALQAQEPASPYIALWNRVARFDPADLDAAFADSAVVKASLIRITLHAVDASDYPRFHDAMESTLRASRLSDRRFTESGLSVAEIDDLLPAVVASLTRPQTRAEVEAFLEGRVGDRKGRAFWALRTYAPLHHAPTGGPWSFRTKASFVAAPKTLDRASPDASVTWLARRYLEGFGPATAEDFARFTLLQRSVARAAITALGTDVEQVDGPDGAALFDIVGRPRPDEDVPAPPRLLPMWDSVLLAHADRSRIVPPDLRRVVTRQNGDVLPTVLVDGQVAGVWRAVDGGIEATAFRPLSDDAWEGLAAEAAALVAFLAGRDPKPYRRYDHWWTHLPSGEVRLLPG